MPIFPALPIYIPISYLYTYQLYNTYSLVAVLDHEKNLIYQLNTQLCNRGHILLKYDHPTLEQCGQRIYDPAFERCENSKTCKTVVEIGKEH